MTHQHGGRPGSMDHEYVNALASRGICARTGLSFNSSKMGKGVAYTHEELIEIAKGGFSTNKGKSDSDTRSSHNRSDDGLVHAAGDEYGYDLYTPLKGKTSKQLCKLIKEIYLTVAAGPKAVIEDILDRSI